MSNTITMQAEEEDESCFEILPLPLQAAIVKQIIMSSTHGESCLSIVERNKLVEFCDAHSTFTLQYEKDWKDFDVALVEVLMRSIERHFCELHPCADAADNSNCLALLCRVFRRVLWVGEFAKVHATVLNGIPLMQHIISVSHAPQIIGAACEVLLPLTFSIENKVLIVNAQCVQVLVEKLRLLRFDEYVCRCICGVLRNIAAYAAIVPQMEEGVVALVDAMEWHAGNAEFLSYLCQAISNVAKSDAGQKQIVASGGVPRLLDIIRACMRTDPDTLHYACEALCEIAYYECNQPLIAQSGGLELVMQVLQHNSTNADVVTVACAALWNISTHASNKTLVSALGGLELLTQILKLHAHNPDVTQETCGALSNVLSAQDDLETLELPGEMLDAAVQALHKHADCPQALTEICWVVAALSINVRFKEAIVNRLKLQESLQQLAFKYSNDPQLLESTIQALVSMQPEANQAWTEVTKLSSTPITSHA